MKWIDSFTLCSESDKNCSDKQVSQSQSIRKALRSLNKVKVTCDIEYTEDWAIRTTHNYMTFVGHKL